MNRYLLVALIAVSSVAIKAQGPNSGWYVTAQEKAAEAARIARAKAQENLDWAAQQARETGEWAGSRMGQARQWARENLPSTQGLQEKGRESWRWAGQKAGQAKEWGTNVAYPAVAENATLATQKAGQMWQYGKQWAQRHLGYNPGVEPGESATE